MKAKAALALGIAVMFALMGTLAVAVHADSIEVGVVPTQVAPGGTVTLTFYFGAATPGETNTATAIQVCSPGTASAPCSAGSTVYSYTGPLPSFVCTSGDLCTGTFVVTYPISSPGICSITSAAGTGTCTPTGSPTCTTTSCWTSGANTNGGNYGVLALYTSTIASGSFSADSGFATPQFGASIVIVAGVSLVGVMVLHRRMVAPSLP